MNTTVENKFLKVSEVAAMARVTDRTVRKWIADKRLPAIKTATGLFRIQSQDVGRVLNQATKG